MVRTRIVSSNQKNRNSYQLVTLFILFGLDLWGVVLPVLYEPTGLSPVQGCLRRRGGHPGAAFHKSFAEFRRSRCSRFVGGSSDCPGNTYGMLCGGRGRSLLAEAKCLDQQQSSKLKCRWQLYCMPTRLAILTSKPSSPEKDISSGSLARRAKA